jgi:hypothetical protein
MNKCLALVGTAPVANGIGRMESPILDNFFVSEGFGIVFVLVFRVIVIVAVMGG